MKRVLGATSDLTKFILNGYRIKWTERDPVRRRQKYLLNMKTYASSLLSKVGVELSSYGQENLNKTEPPRLVVCNHMSYLDILLLIETIPALFVTSVELQKTPLLGGIAEAGGSLFVERRNPARLKKDIKVVGEVLKEGFNLVVFPEGTSGNGDTVMPFRAGLFTVATELQIPVQPVCIKYTHVGSEPFGPFNRDRVCWYGGMTFGPHFFQMCKLNRIAAEVHFLEPIVVTAETDRRELAEEAHERILTCYTNLN
jgi:1-acyl-sn-glycerol-3-phosphate acyltransferase